MNTNYGLQTDVNAYAGASGPASPETSSPPAEKVPLIPLVAFCAASVCYSIIPTRILRFKIVLFPLTRNQG